MESIVLLDADSILYSSCFLSKEQSPDGKSGHYSEDLSDVCGKTHERIMYVINSMMEKYPTINVIHTVVFMEGDGNFRYSIDNKYKSNRKETPPLLGKLKKWVEQSFNAGPLSTFSSINVETDDSIVATYNRYKRMGKNLIIASPDKDMKTVPCVLFDSFHTNHTLYEIDEQMANYNFYLQMLMGDSADHIKGVKGMGPKKSQKLLTTKKGEFGRRRAVWECYLKAYGHRARREYQKNHAMLSMGKGNIAVPDLTHLFF